MKSLRYLALMLPILAGSAMAKIPEPDSILYGIALLEGVPLTAADTHVTVELRINGDLVASYRMGDEPATGDHYVLRVPMDALEPRTAGTARHGDTAIINAEIGRAHV